MKIIIEQDVVGFDITVDDLRLDSMKVGKGIGCFDGNGHPDGPRECSVGCKAPMEVVRQGAIGNELIHKEELTAVSGCAAIKVDEVLVVKARENLDFIHELLNPLIVVLVQAFDCNYAPISKLAWIRGKPSVYLLVPIQKQMETDI